MKLKKIKKILRQRDHNVYAMAKMGMKDFEIAATIGMTPTEFAEGLKAIPKINRKFTIAKNIGYNRDMEYMKRLIDDKSINSSIAKIYFAERYGITDKVEKEDHEDKAKPVELNIFLSE